METLKLDDKPLWRRIERSMEKVEQRLLRAVGILEAAKIPYAVVGGNAVRVWVAQVDEAAVRATQDVDVLVRPKDVAAVKAAMTAGGFFYRETAGLEMFVEQEEDSARNAVHLLLSDQMVRADDYEANPDIEPSVRGEQFRTLTLEALVRMKLNSFQLKDRVHLLDLLEVGLIESTWPERFPGVLSERLQELIDNPNQ